MRLLKNLFDIAIDLAIQPDTFQMCTLLSNLFQKSPLVRVGRKFSMSEELKAQKAIKHYLVEGKEIYSEQNGQQWEKQVDFNNSEIQVQGKLVYEQMRNSGIRLNYKLKPKADKKMMLEGGIAFLLNPQYTYMQWLGNGPYASYPGKCAANTYGLYDMQCGDLYFEGNRMGVDIVCCSDSVGNGFVLIAPHSNVNFEQTDKGVVLSVNTLVSGLCGKLRETAYPVYVDDAMDLTGQVTIIPLRVGEWGAFAHLFKNPKNMEKRNSPFKSQYDTYLLKYSDIVE